MAGQLDRAGSVESLEHLDAREQAYHALKAATQGYVQLMARLHDDPTEIREAQVDNAYASLAQAHDDWLAASGLRIKPV